MARSRVRTIESSALQFYVWSFAKLDCLWARDAVANSRPNRAGSRGRTVTLKVKFNDFEITTGSRSAPATISSRDDLEALSIGLLQNEMPVPKPVRLLGVSLSSLQSDD